MKKLFAVAVALVALFATSPVLAQGVNLQGIQVAPFKAMHAGDLINAVSTDVGIYVKYVGTGDGVATVEVAAGTGDLTFIDTGAATDSFECPVAAPLGGVIDVNDAACDTVGEVLDIINASGDWVAVAAGMLRTDSTDDALNTLAATDAKSPNGLGLLKDTIVALNITNVVFPVSDGGRNAGLQNWLPFGQTKLAKNPFKDRATTLLYASENVTSSGVIGQFVVYCVTPNYDPNGGSEVVQTLYTETGAATTVTGYINEFVNAGGLTCTGGKMLVRMSAGTDLTVPLVLSSGYVRRINE